VIHSSIMHVHHEAPFRMFRFYLCENNCSYVYHKAELALKSSGFAKPELSEARMVIH